MKDPAFLFYPGDFTTGTQFFTDEQVGKYIRLLLAQHQHGHLPENHMIFICKSYDKDVFNKFEKDIEGLYYNIRLETETIKRKEYTKSRGKNREGKIKEKSYDIHMENVNKNKNKDIIKDEKISKEKKIRDKINNEESFSEKYQLKCGYKNGEFLYGNEHQRWQGGLSEMAIEQHCKELGIIYDGKAYEK